MEMGGVYVMDDNCGADIFTWLLHPSGHELVDDPHDKLRRV